ncbi:MAG TPA: DUF58 domain-containing protein [Planctomycetaceae bacterium]|nr:DUF58 domain-containing protein [Planctomycetaceae bacterium]
MVSSAKMTDPAFFSRLDNLELRARGIVEGFMHGLHRSPFVGFSVEFASHREYAQGDDLRHVNWKIFARQKRLYVKEFDAETNMNLHLLIDVSGSMECANSGISKFDYGTTLGAALAHLALKQHDAVGLTLYADEVLLHLEPRAKPHQLDEILQAIATTKARPKSNAGRALSQAAELCRHRGMVAIISDFFDDLPAIKRGLDQLRFRQHEVLAFQVWDRWERDLPLDGNICFTDLETREDITTHAEGVREKYLQAVNQWRNDVQRSCLNRGVDRVEVVTDEPLDQALLDYLVHRTKA